MIEKEDLVIDEDAIFLPPFCYAECGVANKLKRLIDTSSKDLFEEDVNIEKIVRRTGIHYDDVQVAAIKQAVQSKVMVFRPLSRQRLNRPARSPPSPRPPTRRLADTPTRSPTRR